MDDWRHEWEIDPATLEIGPNVGEREFGTVHKVKLSAMPGGFSAGPSPALQAVDAGQHVVMWPS